MPLCGSLAIGVAWLIEKIIPRSTLPPEASEKRADWLFFGLTVVVDSVVVGMFEQVQSHSTGLVVSPLAFGPLAVGLALLVWELGSYSMHRLGHIVPVLWRFHALHHAPGRMIALNNFRLHPLDLVLKNVVALGAVAMLGFDAQTVAIVAVIKNTVVAFQHCDADLRHGWLNYVFSTNTAHRWHHSALPQEGNANFGTVLLIWDIVFGTFRLPPSSNAPHRLGLYDNPNYPTNQVLKALVAPFCWQRCTSTESRDKLPPS